MEEQIIALAKVSVSVLCWAVVAVGAACAIFSPRIQDTLLERIALAAVSFCAIAAAWRAFASGWVTNTGYLISIAFAFYVIAVFRKHALQPPPGGRKA